MPGPDEELILRLMQHVDRLAGLIGPRHVGKPAALQSAAGLIEQEFQLAGYDAVREDYSTTHGPVCNLIAECPGTDRKQEVLIVGAHYDTVATSPGADDNASAVAVLLETARRIRSRSLRRTVRFVAFACEEHPHHSLGEMGSQIHARGCRQRHEQIAGMLCLEMLGYYRTEPGSQSIPPSIPRMIRWFLPRTADFLAAVGNLKSGRLLWQFRQGFRQASHLKLVSMALPAQVTEARRSDNSSFWDVGYPALMITDTSYLRNPHYHQPTDTPETLDYVRMAQAVHGLTGAICRIAQVQRASPRRD
jgi:Zn-dependent M28 family amino/carboxypeptidase